MLAWLSAHEISAKPKNHALCAVAGSVTDAEMTLDKGMIAINGAG